MKLAACQRFHPAAAPRDWVVEPIKKRLRLEYGFNLTEDNRQPGTFPVFGSNGQVGTHDAYSVVGPGILVGRKGSVGEVHFSEGPFWPIDTVYYVRRLAEDDWNYLYYLLGFLNLGTLNAATGLPGLTRRDAHDMLGAFPCDNEQRDIAAALKLADDAIAKAREEAKAAQTLILSLREELFSKGLSVGPIRRQASKVGLIPATWQIKRIKEILIGRPINGYSPQSNPEPPGTKTLNVACIRHGECDVAKATYVDIDEATVQALQVRMGDFFVLRGNGNRDYIGIGGVVRDDLDEAMIYSDLLFRLRFDESEVVPLFMPHLWQTQKFLRRLQSKAKTGSGLWKIGKRDIENELVALPTPAEQREIVQLVEAATRTCNGVAGKLCALKDVKRSLLQSLLTGRIRLPRGIADAK